jgi:diguanylate cyclase (GGDEF)-like protein/PAS domain S-box-containing protein
LIGATAGYIALLGTDDSESELVFLDSGGFPYAMDPTFSMPVNAPRDTDSPIKETVYFNDFTGSEWIQFMPAGITGLYNVLFAPLVIENKTVGSLCLANKPGGFTDDNARLVSAFGELAAIALQNNRTFELLESSEERYRALVENASDAVISFTSKGAIVSWNRQAELIFGYSAHEIQDQPFTILLPSRYRSSVHNKMKRMMARVRPRRTVNPSEISGLKKDGSIFPMELSLTHWKVKDENFFTATCRDISQRKRMEENIKQLAYYDSLTNLPSRIIFIDRANHMLVHSNRNKKKLAIMMLDLDRFKNVNDTLGHNVGDLLLQAVARTLTGLLRKSDTVTRLGGDEFIILLPDIKSEDALKRVTRKIMRAFKTPFILEVPMMLNGREVHITPSIGIVLYPEDGNDVETLMKNADIAMYRAKEAGRNRYRRFSPELSQETA